MCDALEEAVSWMLRRDRPSGRAQYARSKVLSNECLTEMGADEAVVMRMKECVVCWWRRGEKEEKSLSFKKIVGG